MEVNFELNPGERVAPFDIDRAKSGAELRTRDGRAARFITLIKNDSYPVVCITENMDGDEHPYTFTLNGLYDTEDICANDIFIIERVKEFWVNVYNPPNVIEVNPTVYSSKEEARQAADDAPLENYLDSVLVYTKVIEPVYHGIDYGRGEDNTVTSEWVGKPTGKLMYWDGFTLRPAATSPAPKAPDKREYWASMWRCPVTKAIAMDTHTGSSQSDADDINNTTPPLPGYNEYLGSLLVYED